MDELNSPDRYPRGVRSFLDTDLYKLTMQCAVHKFYRNVDVIYTFTNRTRDKKLTEEAYRWLMGEITKLQEITLRPEERAFLREKCPYLNPEYLDFLQNFRFRPAEQIKTDFNGGDVKLTIEGKWVETILYEIPILALTSEAYFLMVDTDWDVNDDAGQMAKAKEKADRLIEAGCIFSEFGTRRRRNYHTQGVVIKGLNQANQEMEDAKKARKRAKEALDELIKVAEAQGTSSSTEREVAEAEFERAEERVGKIASTKGFLAGTSNVHQAMRGEVMEPIGTVAHEWFMGVAGITDDYKSANEEALKRWVGAFGDALPIALTDTFGTPDFLKAFSREVSQVEGGLSVEKFRHKETGKLKTYAEIFKGVRQDSGDPEEFTQMMADYYVREGINVGEKTVVFSDSLNIDRCLQYKKKADAVGLQSSFGVGTYLTNDFNHRDGTKSVPLNIVIKLSSVRKDEQSPWVQAVKISDNIGKNTGDPAKVAEVKKILGYVEKEWAEGDETARWGEEGKKSGGS